MSSHPLFDSYSGDHVEEVLRQIEERNAFETHKEADSEFLRGERSAVAEIRQILAATTYPPRRAAAHRVPASGKPDGAVAKAFTALRVSR